MPRASVDWSAPSYREMCARHRWHIPERLNIAVASCDRWADGSGRLALIDGDDRYSFDDLADRSSRFAGVLAEAGVGRGDRVAVWAPQGIANAVAHLATFKLGAISVPLSPLFGPDALRHRLDASGARAIVTDREFPPPSGGRVAARSAAGWGGVAVLTGAETGPPIDAVADTAADDPAMLIFTSGTTGMPKGVLHAHRFVPGRLSAFELVHRFETGPARDRPLWTPADWSWVAGLVDCVFATWAFGCPVLAHHRAGPFDPDEAFALIARARVRSLFLPPTALHKLRGAARVGDTASVYSVHSAGEPLSADTYAWAREQFGEHFYELYGMTEIGAAIGNSPWAPVRPGSMGLPYPGHAVEIVDDEGRAIDGEGEGEIAIHRDDPGMFVEYWNDPEATAARFRGDLMLTGDLARRDSDGYLWYRGRGDDVFNTSGYRVGPAEIETSLERHPAVARAAVAGEPDSERGHIVKAFLMLRAGFAPSEGLVSEIQTFVKRSLAAYEYPRQVVFVDELPVTVTGKLRRSALRERTD